MRFVEEKSIRGWRPRSTAPRAVKRSSSARWRTCRAWVAMAERPHRSSRETIDALVARGDATAALGDPELAPLARIAADLRHSSPTSRRGSGTTRTENDHDSPATTTAIAKVHHGDPYIRVREADDRFPAQVFDGGKRSAGVEAAAGCTAKRVGDSMVMIGGGHRRRHADQADGVSRVRERRRRHLRAGDRAGATSIGEPPTVRGSARFRRRSVRQPLVLPRRSARSRSPGPGTVTPFLHARPAADYVEFLKRALGAVEEAVTGSRPLRYARLRTATPRSNSAKPSRCPIVLPLCQRSGRLLSAALDAGAKSVMTPADQPTAGPAASRMRSAASGSSGGRLRREARPEVVSCRRQQRPWLR